MEIRVSTGRLIEAKGAVALCPVVEDGGQTGKFLGSTGLSEADVLGTARKAGFTGEAFQTLLLPHGGGWVLLVGLGKARDVDLEGLRRFAGIGARLARSKGFSHVALPLITGKTIGAPADAAAALTEGLLLGLYRYTKFKTGTKKKDDVTRATLVVDRASRVKAAKSGVDKGRTVAEGVTLARDLINGPSNLVTPTYLAGVARDIAKRHKFKCDVLRFAQLKQQGFGGIVGVAQGSEHPAQFIVMDYKPSGAKATLVFCGKGITFDTGGINLKSSLKMELMKYDMSGAAAVLGLLQTVAALKLKVRVVGLIAATENMPSGSAQKPSDILKTLSGKTVEVLNTDAEGRLVLADCLHYAKRYEPDAVVDIATLTGACIVALGSEAIGLMSKNGKLAKRIEAAAAQTSERVWQLPLWDEYGEMMRSDIADIKNVSNTGEAGTISAGKFLEFFAEKLPWAHLDIAGTAWVTKDKPYVPKGAAGICVRLLTHLVEHWR